MVKFKSSSPAHTERHNLGSPETQFQSHKLYKLCQTNVNLEVHSQHVGVHIYIVIYRNCTSEHVTSDLQDEHS